MNRVNTELDESPEPQGETLGDLGQFQHARLEPVVVDQPHLVLVVVVAGE